MISSIRQQQKPTVTMRSWVLLFCLVSQCLIMGSTEARLGVSLASSAARSLAQLGDQTKVPATGQAFGSQTAISASVPQRNSNTVGGARAPPNANNLDPQAQQLGALTSVPLASAASGSGTVPLGSQTAIEASTQRANGQRAPPNGLATSSLFATPAEQLGALTSVPLADASSNAGALGSQTAINASPQQQGQRGPPNSQRNSANFQANNQLGAQTSVPVAGGAASPSSVALGSQTAITAQQQVANGQRAPPNGLATNGLFATPADQLGAMTSVPVAGGASSNTVALGSQTAINASPQQQGQRAPPNFAGTPHSAEWNAMVQLEANNNNLGTQTSVPLANSGNTNQVALGSQRPADSSNGKTSNSKSGVTASVSRNSRAPPVFLPGNPNEAGGGPPQAPDLPSMPNSGSLPGSNPSAGRPVRTGGNTRPMPEAANDNSRAPPVFLPGNPNESGGGPPEAPDLPSMPNSGSLPGSNPSAGRPVRTGGNTRPAVNDNTRAPPVFLPGSPNASGGGPPQAPDLPTMPNSGSLGRPNPNPTAPQDDSDADEPVRTNGSIARVSGEGRGRQNKHYHHNLANTCVLYVEFFDGQAMEPTDEEVDALLFEVKRFLTHLYATDIGARTIFLGVDVVEHSAVYNAKQGNFQIEFETDHDFTTASTIDRKTVNRILYGADYPDFIANYIWESPPAKQNVFYQTHFVEILCES